METIVDSSPRLTFAKFLLVIGAMIGVVPLAVLFSVPIYSLGLLLLWRAPLDQRKKLIWTIVPLIFVLVIWIGVVAISKVLDIDHA